MITDFEVTSGVKRLRVKGYEVTSEHELAKTTRNLLNLCFYCIFCIKVTRLLDKKGVTEYEQNTHKSAKREKNRKYSRIGNTRNLVTFAYSRALA